MESQFKNKKIKRIFYLCLDCKNYRDRPRLNAFRGYLNKIRRLLMMVCEFKGIRLTSIRIETDQELYLYSF